MNENLYVWDGVDKQWRKVVIATILEGHYSFIDDFGYDNWVEKKNTITKIIPPP